MKNEAIPQREFNVKSERENILSGLPFAPGPGAGPFPACMLALDSTI